jgi:endonuclease-3
MKTAKKSDKNRILAIFEIFKSQNPLPTTELHYASPFELLIAVMLSAQATDIGVNRATDILFAEANTPEALVRLGEEGLLPFLQRLNYYRTKSKHVILTSKILIEQHHSQVPKTREALEALPGVGRKTANVILNTAFKQPTLAVDTHIFRVANRLELAKGKTPRQVEDQLLLVIPQDYLMDAHHWLILHGRYTCKAQTPLCQTCVVRDLCPSST